MTFRISSKRNIRIFSFVIFILLPVFTSNKITNVAAQGSYDLNGVKVAVYNDIGADIIESWLALVNMFEWMNATVDTINATQVQRGTIFDYDIFVMPGGHPNSYRYMIGNKGIKNIRNFISEGGSYFGICGGAHFAVNLGLNIFSGSLIYPIPGIMGGSYMINMTINRKSTRPNLSNEPKRFSTLFLQSPYFQANDPSKMIPIAYYGDTNFPGMIAFKYGLGTVFLSNPHPEYEEGSDRDGTTEFDNYNDPESEWGLLLTVSRWVVLEIKNVTIWIFLGITEGLIITTVFYIILKQHQKERII